MSTLKNKFALVTGGSRGIGRAISLRLAKDGAFVIVNYAGNKQAAEDTVAAIKAAGGQAAAVQADVSSVASIKAMFKTIDDISKGQLHILVNNAGVYPMAGLEDADEATFDKVFNANVKGLFFVTQEAVKRMPKGGKIVNISTALTRIGSMPALAVYNASKGAVDIFTRDFAQQLGAKGITVNAVNPGLVNTEGTAGMTADPQTVAHFNTTTALGRIGEPDDIAEVVGFLAGDGSRWVTAQKIEASGGSHL